MRSASASLGPGGAGSTWSSVALDVRVAELGQALAGRAAGGNGGQAPGRVAAVRLDVQGGQGLDGRPLGGIEVPQGDEVVGQGPRLVAGPGVERGDELLLVDQPGLEGQQAEEKVIVGGHGALPWGWVAEPSRVGVSEGAVDPRDAGTISFPPPLATISEGTTAFFFLGPGQ